MIVGCELEAVTFDFWGTLVDGRFSPRAHRLAVLQSVLGDLSHESIAQAYQQAWARFGAAALEGYGLPPATVLNMTLQALGRTLGAADHRFVLRAWEEAILDRPPPLLQGATEVLRTLRGRGLWIGLISDTGVTPGRVLRAFLVRCGLRPFFDWLTFSDEMGITKRNPFAFLITLRAMGGVRPDRALHVGDSPETDIEGAHKAGMRAALVLESSGRREGCTRADLCLDRLVDLLAVLG